MKNHLQKRCEQLSFSMDHNPDRKLNLDSSNVPWQAMCRSASFRMPGSSARDQTPMMGNQALVRVSNAIVSNNSTIGSNPPEEGGSSITSTLENPETESKLSEKRSPLIDHAHMWISLYVTLTQATLALLIFLLYGFYKLLDEYLQPIIWAAVCSIPLRGIQDALIEFWSEPLRLGLTETISAVPIALLKAFASTIIDARDVLSWVCYGENPMDVRPEKNGFLRLVRRLVSFGLFVFAYEQIGRFGAFTLIGLGLMFSSNLSPSTLSAVSTLRSDSFRLRGSSCSSQDNHNLHFDKVSRVLCHWMLSRLKTILAVGLIIGVIIGGLAGAIFISYQIGAEGKDAVVSIKSHIKENNYAEEIGIRKWINETNALELMDWYASECYGTLVQQIDDFAEKYNLSELLEVIKQIVIIPYTSFSAENSYIFEETKYTFRLKNLMEKPVLDKAKCFATQGVDLSFRILASSKFILDGSAHFLLYIGQSIFSGAAGLMQFLVQTTVFFWVLYYLLTSESGGVTEQVMKIIPAPKPTKDRCVGALNNAISGVLLATAEIAFFQGCFTWLLCRLFSVHFAYMSTMLAFLSPLLPIFPLWLPALPGAAELLLDGRYVLGIAFCVTHMVVMDYGASEIAEGVPGYSTYLIGVSIIGGMTLFPSVLEVNLSLFLVCFNSIQETPCMTTEIELL